MDIIDEIKQERDRQVNDEGYSTEHDDALVDGQLATAAAVYASTCTDREVYYPDGWVFKPEGRRRELIKAAALIVAEIERLDRRRMMERVTENSASEKDGAVLPIPCTKGYDEWTVKQWFAKINEELDEMKNAVFVQVGLDWRPYSERFDGTGFREIAEEAADTITAITSMLEAMGIDEEQRQAAQRRVNERNQQRGRW